MTKTARRRIGQTPGKGSGKAGGSANDDQPEDDGPDEAAGFIAETLAGLARLSRRHRLGILTHLIEMAQLEAEERVRLRSKQKLS